MEGSRVAGATTPTSLASTVKKHDDDEAGGAGGGRCGGRTAVGDGEWLRAGGGGAQPKDAKHGAGRSARSSRTPPMQPRIGHHGGGASPDWIWAGWAECAGKTSGRRRHPGAGQGGDKRRRRGLGRTGEGGAVVEQLRPDRGLGEGFWHGDWNETTPPPPSLGAARLRAAGPPATALRGAAALVPPVSPDAGDAGVACNMVIYDITLCYYALWR